MTVLAVDGHEIFRSRQRVHQLELLLTSVSGDVDVRQRVVNDLHALAEQLVDDRDTVHLVRREWRWRR